MSHGNAAKNFAPQVAFADAANISRYTTSYWLYGISAVPLRIVILASRNICFMEERKTRYRTKLCKLYGIISMLIVSESNPSPSEIYIHFSPMCSRGSFKFNENHVKSILRVKSATAFAAFIKPGLTRAMTLIGKVLIDRC